MQQEVQTTYIFEGQVFPTTFVVGTDTQDGWHIDLCSSRLRLTISSDEDREVLWNRAGEVARIVLDDIEWKYPGQRLSCELITCREIPHGAILVSANDALPEMQEHVEVV